MPTLNVSPQAAELLIERRRSRSSFLDWARLSLPLVSGGKEPALHHRLIIDKLQQLAERKIMRLALFLPPGSAKSTYASILFGPWALAQASGQCIIAASHSIDKAEEFGRKCRNLIIEQQRVLGYRLQADSKAAGRWKTSNRGEYVSMGAGSGIAGYRADLVIIDDPIGKKEDAESAQIREKHWDWWKNDIKPRLKPNAIVVLIMTRWHDDDLGGRILENESADWEIVRLPLLAEQDDPMGRQPGEALWPEWFNSKMIRDAQQYPATFSALYQQRPTPPEGDFFKADMLKGYDASQLPKDLAIYVGSDHAFSTKESADRTCIIPVGVDSEGVLWVLPDVWWKRAPSDEVVEAMLDVCRRRKPITWWTGREHITQAIGPFLRVRMRETSTYVPLEEVVSVHDKRSRATAVRDRMAMGGVRFPTFASTWWPQAKEELLKFTGNDDKHDDFVDALAEVGRGLDRLVRPRIKKVETLDAPLTWGWLKAQDKRHKQLNLVREY
jgi:predicted phage terminase large subunit-like protein